MSSPRTGSANGCDRLWSSVRQELCRPAPIARPDSTPPLVPGEPLFYLRREQLIALAAQHAVPAIYEYREFTAGGGLLSYGLSLTDTFRVVAFQVVQILKGAKPADLPILQPTKFELVINLRTAKALGLTIPEIFLGRADEVIE